ncbi:MAG TPA: hypothetical protein VH478_20280 [Trebonia sp.]|nr:hypothetical protein [Trebonia sp.]
MEARLLLVHSPLTGRQAWAPVARELETVTPAPATSAGRCDRSGPTTSPS